ncbi:MAG TPA: SpoIIE family protein phosphatase, partial [Bacteroidia bacterium]|nr:SpoIIE family protein phosphatase [Bacteroidia bacterium]
ALQMSNETHARQKTVTCYMLLAEVYKSTGEFQAAFEQLETGYRVKVELSGEEASNRIKHLQQKNATERADKEAEIHRLKNVELKQAYDEIEEKNKSILDSINYAKRIQTALLGSAQTIKRNLPEHFVHYRPKDIVSGDFYWCAEKNNQFFFAVADCTGHGVPGAFMSLLNINLLNRAVSENNLSDPGAILDFVRTHVIASLNAEGQEPSRDGMDAVVFVLDRNAGTLRFACANNVLLHVRNKNMTVHGPDKFPVGLSHTEQLQPFTSHEVALQTGDSIFISTDGYPDQFGGERGKKFKQTRLRELLAANAGLALNEQSKILGEKFLSWKGDLEQVDDILIFGFRW